MAESRTSDYDRQNVVISKSQPKGGRLKSEQELSQALRAGVKVDAEKKFAAGSNKQHANVKNSAILDQETETFHHETVPADVARAIQQGRQNTNLTQKDLAQKINEKPSVVQEYEQGKALNPNPQILAKMERVLNMKLRGKDIGKPLK